MCPRRSHSNLKPPTSNLCLFIKFRTLFPSRNSQLLSFQPFPHSLPKTPGGISASHKNRFNACWRLLPRFPASCESPCGDSCSCPSLLTVNCQLSARISALECAVTKTRSHNSFGMRSCEKRLGGGALFMTAGTRANDKEKVRDHYDRMSPYYHSLWGEHIHHGYWIRGDESKETAQVQLIEHLAQVAKIQPDAQILDVGCGFGA